MSMGEEIDWQEYEIIGYSREEAYAKAVELLELSPDSSEEAVNAYIDSHHEWYRDDEKYRYIGYDCGDCYIGGDVKKGIVCGDCLVVYVACPNYKLVRIYKKR